MCRTAWVSGASFRVWAVSVTGRVPCEARRWAGRRASRGRPFSALRYQRGRCRGGGRSAEAEAVRAAPGWAVGGAGGNFCQALPLRGAPWARPGHTHTQAHDVQRTRPLLAHRSPLAPQSCSHPNLLPRRRWGNEIQCETGRSPAMTIPNCQKQCFLSGLLKCRHSCFLC